MLDLEDTQLKKICTLSSRSLSIFSAQTTKKHSLINANLAFRTQRKDKKKRVVVLGT